MPVVTLDTLKGYFNNGDVPSELNYIDLIDSLSNNLGNAIGSYQGLLGLRGFWPMSSMSETPSVIDLSGQGRSLTKSGSSATLGVSDSITSGIPYGLFSSSNYLYRADEAGLDISGTETSIHSSFRGLTCGAWIRVTTTPSNDVAVLSKYLTTGNQRSYMLWRNNYSGKFRFGISGDGTNVSVIDASQSIVLNNWNFIVGRFIPSTKVSIFHNGYWSDNTSSIPASIYNSTARFELGAFDTGGYTWSHNGGFYFITASAISDFVINRLYNLTKSLFIL